MSKLKLKLPTNKKKFKITIFGVAIFIVLCVYVISLFIPIIWATYSAMNPTTDYIKFYVFHGKFPTNRIDK